jgi:hypothetical protein
MTIKLGNSIQFNAGGSAKRTCGKSLKIFSISIGVLVLILIIWAASIFYLFMGVKPYVPDPVYSPDRSILVIPSVNYDKAVYDTYLLVHLKILDARTQKVCFRPKLGPPTGCAGP